MNYSYYPPYNYQSGTAQQYMSPNGLQSTPALTQIPSSITSMPNAQTGFRCIPVTSQTQADTFQIPFDGSTTYFVDTSNGKIYSKTFDFNTGSAPLVTYIRESAEPVIRYATIEELNALREELTVKPKKAVKKNDDADE